MGDMTQLNALLISMHTSALGCGKAAVEFISAELDEHLPFVKKGVDEALAKAGALYQEHIGSATWVGAYGGLCCGRLLGQHMISWPRPAPCSRSTLAVPHG